MRNFRVLIILGASRAAAASTFLSPSLSSAFLCLPDFAVRVNLLSGYVTAVCPKVSLFIYFSTHIQASFHVTHTGLQAKPEAIVSILRGLYLLEMAPEVQSQQSGPPRA